MIARHVSAVRHRLHQHCPKGRALTAGLLAAFVGILVFSVAQHPLLRLDFQIFFWILAALVVGSVHLSPAAFRPAYALTGVLVVLLSTLVQYAADPLTDRSQLSYGFRPAPSDLRPSFIETEAVVFTRIPENPGGLGFWIRNWRGEGVQRIGLFLNGEWNEVELRGEEWMPVLVPGREGRFLDLGIRVEDPVPAGFTDSWGGGVLVSKTPNP
jgi:hypothetical protein